MFAPGLSARVGSVTAVDLSDEMIRQAVDQSAGLPNVRFVHGDFFQLPWREADSTTCRLLQIRRGWYEPAFQVRTATMSYREVRSAATVLLPGAAFRLLLLFRYLLLWRKGAGRRGSRSSGSPHPI